MSARTVGEDDDAGIGMEDSQLICAYLDSLDGKPRFHDALRASDWDCLRLEFAVRMAHLILAVALDRAHKSGAGDLTAGRPLLAVWMRAMSDSPSMQRTALA